MSEHTNIEWCDATFNPWIGCTKVSPACDHCYAERDFDLRRHVVQWGAGQERKRTAPANWKLPERWNNQAFVECPACGWRGEARDAMHVIGLLNIAEAWCPACRLEVVQPARRRVFCASLADVFDNEVPAEWRADLMQLIVSTPNLDWLLLTKRIGNAERLIAEAGDLIDYGDGWQSLWGQGEWPRNVWLGSTICNQAEADRDIPKLLATPAAVRFVSIEPMLGPIDLTLIPHSEGYGSSPCDGCGTAVARDALDGSTHCESGCDGPILTWLDWVIVGGESGPKARPMHPDWARSLRDQCTASSVPFLFKQWGEWTPGENVEKRTGVVQSATWFGEKLLMGTEDLAVEDGHIDDEPDLYRVGKKAAGRLLDGVEHNGFPRGAA